MKNILSKSEDLMRKTLEHFKKDLTGVSTGRATPELLNSVRVESYGSVMPLNQVSNITVLDNSTLSIQVWDKSMVSHVEKGILNANLGFNPMVDGQIIRISIPKLTEERRKDLCKLVKKYAEDSKVSVRNTRREALDEVKKDKSLYSEDEVKGFNEDIQNLTDKYIKQVDEILLVKEKDIMTI